MRISSADWFKAGVARQRVVPISLGIAPRACMILSKLLLLLLLLLSLVLSFFNNPIGVSDQAWGTIVTFTVRVLVPGP